MLLEHARAGTLAVISSSTLIAELAEAGTPRLRDSADDHVLALARFANADMVVSGDDDLLVIKHFAGIPIVTPAEAVKRLVR